MRMKAFRKLLTVIFACLLFTCGAAIGTDSGNILSNPGAEKLLPSSEYPKKFLHYRTSLAPEIPEGWGCYNGNGRCTWGSIGKEAHSGKRSVFLEFTEFSKDKNGSELEPDIGICIGNSNGYIGEKAIRAMPDTAYYFSFYLKGDIRKVDVTVTGWETKDCTSQGRQVIEPTLKSITPTGNWTKYEGGFVTKSKTGYFTLMLYVRLPAKEIRKGQTLYVDDAEIKPFVIAKLDTGSPRPVKVAVYDNKPANETGRKYIYEALKSTGAMAPDIITDLRKETLKKYDVLILSALTELSVADKADMEKGINWKESLLNFVDGGKGIILGHDCAGYRYTFAQDKLFSQISAGKEQSQWLRELKTTDGNHPIMKNLPPAFSHSYYDHIVLVPGPDATVLAKDQEGNPVIVAGNFSRGRVVSIGYPMGHWTEKEPLKDWTAPLPEAEKNILYNSVLWCAEPARYDIPDMLTQTVLLRKVIAFNKNMAEAEDMELLNFKPSDSYRLPFAPPGGNPPGGGKGYNRIILEDKANYAVSAKNDLLRALCQATPGQIIYVRDDAVIDLTGCNEITIPAGVTLASGRGKTVDGNKVSEGGIIRTFSHGKLFVVGGENIRITGLRLGGPAPGLNPESSTSCGVRSFFPLEVDNCNIWGWVQGVSLDGTDNFGSYVHNNLIHHCRRQGMGYGVCISGGGSVRIEENIFDYCRHAVAANKRTSYEAAYNIFGKNMTSHTLDMHGVSDGEKTYMLVNWRLNENDGNIAYDNSEGRSHSHVNNLTISGAQRVKNEKYKGRLGSALKFNGQSDYAECPDASDFRCFKGSVEFWIKAGDRGICRDILFLHGDADNSFLIRKNASDRLELIIKEQGKVKIDAVSAKVLDENYHHVIISGGTGLRIYIDGIWSELTGAGLSSQIWTSHMKNPKLRLGGGLDNFFAGILDEVRIYSQRLDDDIVVQHFKYPDMAGDYLKIHHNIFYSNYSVIIGIRGIPVRKNEIYANYFEGSNTPAEAIRQYAPSKYTYTWSTWENIDAHDNVFTKKQ